MILGSTEWRNVEGEDTYWPMGLAVAPAINRRTLSAAKAPVGNRLTQSPVPLLSLAETEALIIKLVFLFRLEVLRACFTETKWLKFRTTWRVFRVGFNGREGKVTVATVQFVQFIGWGYPTSEPARKKRFGVVIYSLGPFFFFFFFFFLTLNWREFNKY